MTDLDHNQEPGSVIRKIMVEQEEKTRGALNPLVVAMDTLSSLKEREREVIINRYGLTGGKKTTLEAIGQKLQVTRERVRQIEAMAVKRMITAPGKDLVQLIKIINSHLTGIGGLADLEGLARYLKIENDSQRETELNALRLVMAVNGEVVELPHNRGLKIGWAQKRFSLDLIEPVLRDITTILRKKSGVMTEGAIWDQLVATDVYAANQEKLTPSVMAGVMQVAEVVTQVEDGKWGLSEWPSVVPKRIRDKVFLILQKKNAPMHFRDIAEAINREYPSKPVLSRTVHNELIGDQRFVLVGRGIYALTTWGYHSGVVADVIKEVLTGAGRPLTTDEIAEQVLKVRQVKKNTVVANLQNKALFARAGKGTYTLA
ncbi:MAG: sigma factor-like helix-turn-helix DNA-binding protein [bacterium]